MYHKDLRLGFSLVWPASDVEEGDVLVAGGWVGGWVGERSRVLLQAAPSHLLLMWAFLMMPFPRTTSMGITMVCMCDVRIGTHGTSPCLWLL